MNRDEYTFVRMDFVTFLKSQNYFSAGIDEAGTNEIWKHLNGNQINVPVNDIFVKYDAKIRETR